MIVSKMRLSRRTVLRSLGASFALPFLDAMVPAFAQTATQAEPPRRFLAVYLGNGMNMDQWTPAREGPLHLSPTLEPLERFNERLLVLSGLDNEPGRSIDSGGLHSRIQPAWLTGAHARRTEGPDVEAGTSMDQVAADTLGRTTQLRSLELALESVHRVGACEPAFACTYMSTIAWRDATTPLPMEVNPRAVFERLFGDGSNGAARRDELRKDRSLLDWVTGDIAGLQRRLGSADQQTVDEYFDTIRRVEQHIARAETEADQAGPTADLSRFLGVPSSFEAHLRLMSELLRLAFQADLTRVATLMLVRERSDRAFPESGVAEAIHPLSHHENAPEKLAQQARLNRYLVGQFATILDALQASPEAGATLLDRSLVLFGSGMSNSNLHSSHDVPTLVVGSAPVGIRGGQHLRLPRATPLANLQRTLLAKLGAPTDRFGNSTGSLPAISGI